MLRLKIVTGALVLCAMSATADAKKAPTLTPMELQAIQAREFETTKDVLFASVMSVFQDLGYQVSAADMQTGFINASSANVNKTNFLGAMAGVTSSGNTRATAFVEQMPNGLAKVRLNFMSTRSDSSRFGSGQNDKPVLDPVVYRTAWDKIDEALFVRGAMTSKAPAPTATTAPAVVPASVPATN